MILTEKILRNLIKMVLKEQNENDVDNEELLSQIQGMMNVFQNISYFLDKINEKTQKRLFGKENMGRDKQILEKMLNVTAELYDSVAGSEPATNFIDEKNKTEAELKKLSAQLSKNNLASIILSELIKGDVELREMFSTEANEFPNLMTYDNKDLKNAIAKFKKIMNSNYENHLQDLAIKKLGYTSLNDFKVYDKNKQDLGKKYGRDDFSNW